MQNNTICRGLSMLVFKGLEICCWVWLGVSCTVQVGDAGRGQGAVMLLVCGAFVDTCSAHLQVIDGLVAHLATVMCFLSKSDLPGLRLRLSGCREGGRAAHGC